MNVNKLSLFAFVLLFSTTSFAYNITIKINKAPNTKFFLGYYYGDNQYIKDSATTNKDGVMVFKGNEHLQGGIYLIANIQKALLFDFIVTEQNFSLETDTVDYVNNMKIKGSEENTVFFEYSKFTSKIATELAPYEKAYKSAKEKNDTAELRKNREKIAELEAKLTDYRTEVINTKPKFLLAKTFLMMRDPKIPEAPILENGKQDSSFVYNYYKEHFLDNFDFSDDRIVYTPVFAGRIIYYITKVIIQIPDSINKAADKIVGAALKHNSREISKWAIFWITNHYETSQYMGMDAVFVHMAKKYYADSTIAYWVDETLRYKIADKVEKTENNLIGLIGPNLAMPDTAWNIRELHKIKSKYTLVIFWDANCGRCKEEIPHLQKLYERLNKQKYDGGKYFEVYAVSLTPTADDWFKYVAQHKLPWINVSDLYNNSKYRKLYDVYSTPVIYLLGKDKKILAKRLSVEQVGEVIERGIE
ncbi:MAG: DUF5106 domain-containing protein [Bacteroidia bacterium]|nr:DUF5106 domain-containing protein [Bacteroidia bacterium]